MGNFYPKGAKPSEFLFQYARRLNNVEGNTTFYAIPSKQTPENWIENTPETFRFCPKVPKAISHEGRLADNINKANVHDKSDKVWQNNHTMLLQTLKSEALQRGYIKPEEEIDLKRAFFLVRDMPYTRASSRDSETIIHEWRGTCSGKHYLLKKLFTELGYKSRLIACTTVNHIDPKSVSGKLRKLLEQSNGRFVDVHNYLILELPEGEMIVDATWPLATKEMGLVVNEDFVPGVNHQIATKPIKEWVVPEEGDSQEFKNMILKESFTPEELAHREEFIKTLGIVTNSKWTKFLVWWERLLKGQK